ncbi:restriction endonuclease subunit S [Candidatus Parcubacteria bacterium]|nr:MAG: restriction endonuclease subunit S [Candidatus Parcubacteria bacterium]
MVSEIFDIKNGYTPSKKKSEYWEKGNIPWFRLEDIRLNGRILCDAIQHVTESAVKSKLIPANSIIMSTTATLGEHALITVPFITNQQITSFSLKKEAENAINIKFLFYYFYKFGNWVRQNANFSGSVGIINSQRLKQFKVPLPPLEEQKRIVAILDKFDTLTHSISEGLPREIELRQKQYEYYRDLLLSFPRDSQQERK